MKKIKCLMSIIVLVFVTGYVVAFGNFNILNLRNDSGFDTSYDSGGGGSWDSGGSSWDHDSSSSSSSSGEPMSDSARFAIIIFIFIMIVISILSTIYANKNNPKKRSITKELTEEDIQKIIPNFNLKEFLEDRLNDFIKIQYAWQEFDYGKLREKLTDSLYNQYVMQLDTLKVKNQKNIMSDFKKIDEVVTNVKEENGKYIVEIGLLISFKDYIEENGKVVRGDNNATIIQKYKLKFICAKEEQFEYCPNCGAKLNNTASQTCEYCRTTISRVSTNWVLCEKKSIEQETLY